METIIETLQGTGVVRIESNPPGADVYLDGEYYGKSPITIKDVEMGLHTYTIKCPGHPDYVSSLNVVAGELCTSKYDFTNYEVTESCPPIQLASGTGMNTNGMNTNGMNTNMTGLGIQSLQEPAPIPGYVIMSQNTIIWMLAGALAAILIYDYVKKRS